MNFSENIILENDRVRLAPLSLEHMEALLPISIAYPDLLRHSPSPFGAEVLFRENVDQAIQARENKQRYSFVIFDKKTSRYAGSTSYGNISMKVLRLEIGWTWLYKAAQGTGLNKQCKFLLLSYAFNKLGMQRVEFKADRRNVQSRKAMEKIGAVYEGMLRSHTLMRDGHRKNTVYYRILRSEWGSIANNIFGEIK